jgi:hypothetical protein
MEAGSAFNISQWNAFWEPGQSDVISVNDTGLGLRYGAQATYRGNPNYTNRYSQRFSTTYVTGTHSIKVGFQDSWGPFNRTANANADLYQNYVQVNGVDTLAPRHLEVDDAPVGPPQDGCDLFHGLVHLPPVQIGVGDVTMRGGQARIDAHPGETRRFESD